jgi:Uma2 family endonuclease
MATDTKSPARSKDAGRRIYRLTGEQVLRMVETGILPETTRLELWHGILYKITKYEPHNFSVAEVSDILHRLISKDYHVREEKSARHGDYSLTEPDVAVARRPRRAYQTRLPELRDMALVVEVCASTEHADRVVMPPRFAAAGIPVYWLIDQIRRRVEIHANPTGSGKDAHYARVESYDEGRDFPVVIDGQELGRINVSEILPAPVTGDEPAQLDPH